MLDRRPANALPGSANADAGRKTAGTATATAIPVDAVAVNVSLDGGGRSRRGTRPPLAPRLSSGHARRETRLLPGGNGRDRLDDDRAGAPAPHHDDEQLIPGRRRRRDDLAQPDFPGAIDARPFMHTRFAGPRRFDRADAGERRRHRRTLVRISEHAPSSRRDDGFSLDDERPIAVELLLDREPRHQPFVSAAVRVAIRAAGSTAWPVRVRCGRGSGSPRQRSGGACWSWTAGQPSGWPRRGGNGRPLPLWPVLWRPRHGTATRRTTGDLRRELVDETTAATSFGRRTRHVAVVRALVERRCRRGADKLPHPLRHGPVAAPRLGVGAVEAFRAARPVSQRVVASRVR